MCHLVIIEELCMTNANPIQTRVLTCLPTMRTNMYSLMPMSDPVSISCTHRFCRECILHNLKRKAACPLCNKKYDRRSLNTLDHMDKVIDSFLSLKEIYEHEYGHGKPKVLLCDFYSDQGNLPLTQTFLLLSP